MNTSHDLQYYIDYIKRDVYGSILTPDLSDEEISQYVLDAFEEIKGYIDTTVYITVPYKSCIDLKDCNQDIATIVNIYRTSAGIDGGNKDELDATADPALIQMYSYSTGAGGYSMHSWLINYMSYCTYRQIRNTIGSELDYTYDKSGEKLYITTNYTDMKAITIEFIPLYNKVDQIIDDYWINILKKLSTAFVKQAEGRIKTRFVQGNALYTDDGQAMLEEAITDIKEIRQQLTDNDLLFTVLD